MRPSLAALSLALIARISASPAPFPNGQPLPTATCQLVSAVISSLKSCATPTPFCSSFLHISPTTTTVTKTASAIATVTQSVVTGTNTLTAPPVIVTSIATATVTVCTTDIGGIWDKRGLEERNAPTTISTPTPSCTIPGVKGTLNCAAISTACQCLNIPTPTATITATAKVTAINTVTAKLAATTTITPTDWVPFTVTVTETVCPTSVTLPSWD